MAKRKVTYPVSAIDEGMSLSIKNASELALTALKLNELGDNRIAIILYTYAVEEFGKAILLKERKEKAIASGQSEIKDDDVTFTDHRAKIDAANPLLDELARLPLIELPDKGTVFFGKPKIKANFLGVANRVDALLVDFDESTKVWNKDPELPLWFIIKEGIMSLQYAMGRWENPFDMKQFLRDRGMQVDD